MPEYSLHLVQDPCEYCKHFRLEESGCFGDICDGLGFHAEDKNVHEDIIHALGVRVLVYAGG